MKDELEAYDKACGEVLFPEDPESFPFAIMFRPSFHRETALWIEEDGKVYTSWTVRDMWRAKERVDAITRSIDGGVSENGLIVSDTMLDDLPSHEFESNDLIVFDGMGVSIFVDETTVWDGNTAKIADHEPFGDIISFVWSLLKLEISDPDIVARLGRHRSYLSSVPMDSTYVSTEIGDVAIPVGAWFTYDEEGDRVLNGYENQTPTLENSDYLDFQAIRVKTLPDAEEWHEAIERSEGVILDDDQQNSMGSWFSTEVYNSFDEIQQLHTYKNMI